jgi:hypothetical protein
MRMTPSPFQKDIEAAIPLLRVDPHSADKMLSKIHARARKAGDRRASLWSLRLLQMLVGVMGRDPRRYAKLCREVAREAPAQPMSHVFLGSAEEALGKRTAATAAFRRALTLSKNDPETASCARECLARLGEYGGNPKKTVRRAARPRSTAKRACSTARRKSPASRAPVRRAVATPRRVRKRSSARPS